MRRVWQEALEALQLPLPRIELPELSVRLEGDCGFYKDYDVCVSLSMLISSLSRIDIERRNKAKARIYWPQKGDKGYQQLLLLLLAAAYPYPVSISQLKDILESYGLDPEPVRKLLYRYYYYYQAVERVGYGMYRMRDDYYELLNQAMPDWRVRLHCLRQSYIKYGKNYCEEILQHVKESLLYLINNENIRESQRVAKSREKSRLVTNHVTLWDSENNYHRDRTSKGCLVDIKKIVDILRTRKPALYEELKGEENLAAEIIAVLYKRAREGRPYIAAGDPSSLHTALADEAYGLFGGSSSLWGTLSWDSIRWLIMLLRASGIIFTARYGSDFKLRIDKKFEKVLDREEVIRCA